MKKPLIAVITILSAAALVMWLWKHGYFLPSWVTFQEKEIMLDEERTLSLTHRRLTDRIGDTVLYQTPDNWYVSDVLTDDFDEDGIQEVLFLVWRQGVYGASHPFWENPDNDSFCQHLYIFEVRDSGLHRQWMSSALRPMFAEWKIENHRLCIKDPYGESSVWKWHGFGVERTDNQEN